MATNKLRKKSRCFVDRSGRNYQILSV